MDAKVLHKGINIVTNLASTSNPQKNRSAQLAHLKMFSKAHGLTMSDWNMITSAATARMPVRLSQMEK